MTNISHLCCINLYTCFRQTLELFRPSSSLFAARNHRTEAKTNTSFLWRGSKQGHRWLRGLNARQQLLKVLVLNRKAEMEFLLSAKRECCGDGGKSHYAKESDFWNGKVLFRVFKSWGFVRMLCHVELRFETALSVGEVWIKTVKNWEIVEKLWKENQYAPTHFHLNLATKLLINPTYHSFLISNKKSDEKSYINIKKSLIMTLKTMWIIIAVWKKVCENAATAMGNNT